LIALSSVMPITMAITLPSTDADVLEPETSVVLEAGAALASLTSVIPPMVSEARATGSEKLSSNVAGSFRDSVNETTVGLVTSCWKCAACCALSLFDSATTALPNVSAMQDEVRVIHVDASDTPMRLSLSASTSALEMDTVKLVAGSLDVAAAEVSW